MLLAGNILRNKHYLSRSRTYPVLASGTYYLAAEGYDGCWSANCSSLAVTIYPVPNTPIISATPSAQICAGNSVTLSATPGVGETINWGSYCTGTDLGPGNTLVVTPAASNTYYAGSIGPAPGSCASACASQPITVETVPPPTSPSVSQSPICETSTATLSAIPASGFDVQWYLGSCNGALVSNGDPNPVVSQHPSGVNTYYYYAQGIDHTTGCTSSTCVQTQLTVYQQSGAGNTVGANSHICLTPPNYQSTGTMGWGNGVGSVQEWLSENNTTNPGVWNHINNTTNTYTDYPTTPGQWFYETEIQNGVCPAVFSTTQEVDVLPLLQVQAVISPGGNPSPICSGTSVTFTCTETTYTANGGAPAWLSSAGYEPTPSYQWYISTSSSNYFATTLGTSGTYTNNFPTSGTYYITCVLTSGYLPELGEHRNCNISNGCHSFYTGKCFGYNQPHVNNNFPSRFINMQRNRCYIYCKR